MCVAHWSRARLTLTMSYAHYGCRCSWRTGGRSTLCCLLWQNTSSRSARRQRLPGTMMWAMRSFLKIRLASIGNSPNWSGRYKRKAKGLTRSGYRAATYDQATRPDRKCSSSHVLSSICHVALVSSQQRKFHLKGRTGAELALYSYLSTMRLDDPLHDGQAQTGASWLLLTCHNASLFDLARARLVHLVEALKERGKMLLGDAGTIVLHAHHGPSFLLTGEFDMHTGANPTGIFDGILDQIHEHTAEKLWISTNQQLW